MFALLAFACFYIHLVLPLASHPNIETMLTLLTLKERNCSEVSWCTLTRSSDGKHKPDSCCTPCSCEAGCQKVGTCCPDYQLSRALEGLQFYNVTDVEEAYNFVLSTGVLNYTDHSNNSRDTSHGSEGSECMSVSLLPYSPYRKAGMITFMVVTCTGEGSRNNIKSLCEHYTVASVNATMMSRYTPVQSHITGNLYRNIYCFQCSNELRSEYTVWQPFIVSTIRQLSWTNAVTFDTLEDLFYSFYEWASSPNLQVDIIFNPPADSALPFLIPSCSIVDVRSCDKDGNFSSSLVDACSRHTAPVNVFKFANEKPFQTYKNIACVHCNSLGKFDRCQGNTINNEELQKSFSARVLAIDDRVTSGRDIGGGALANVFDSTGYCKPGFALDEKKDICRKVYCPHNFIIDRGQCVPLFEQFEDIVYSASFDIVGYSFAQNATQNLYDFLTQRFDALYDVHLVDSALYRSSDNQPMLFLEYRPRNTDDSVHSVNKALLEYLEDDLLTRRGLSLSFVDIKKPLKGFSWININGKTSYKQVYPEHNRDTNRKGTLHVTRDHLCYRVRLEKDEFIRSGRGIAMMTETGYLPINNNFLFSDTFGQPLVCADLVIMDQELPEYYEYSIKSEKILIERTESDVVDFIIKYLIPGLIAATFVISPFIACFIKNRNRHH